MTRRTEGWRHDKQLIEYREVKNVSVSVFAQRFNFKTEYVREQAIRLGLDEEKKPVKMTFDSDQGAAFKDRISPLQQAKIWCGESSVTDKGFFLRGQQVSLEQLMRATNRKRKAYGLEQITVNQAWVVE